MGGRQVDAQATPVGREGVAWRGASHGPRPLQIVLHREEEVKTCECDMASLHHLLSQIPQNLPYEDLIAHAQRLFLRYPPSLLTKRAALQSRKR